jgi:hypothetical protein
MFGKKPAPRLRILDAMALRRAYLHEPLGAGEAREFEAAKRRCLACHRTALCDEALGSGDAAGFSRFCPNCGFLQHVSRKSLEF